ncbi:uncharacterized protein LOC144490864, partial [Mustelus asterias]
MARLVICNREEENAVKVENPSVLSVLKGQVTKGCSRFLPKGTKAKVNLEDQGRQKVSFTFNVTKTLRNRFQSAIGSEPDEVKVPPLSLPPISVKGSQDSKSDSDSADAAEATASPPKSKVEWSKVHFKKKHLNDAAKPAALSDREPCSSSVEEPADAAVKKDCTGGTETVTKVAAERKPSNQNLSTSHIGKGDNLEEFKNVSSSSSENDELRKIPQVEEAVPAQSAGSESEGDLLRKSQEMRSTESDRDVKKNPIASKVDEVEKVSSYSKPERDKRSSGRSKSDRDLRRTSSRSKYGREERVSSSRSRSDRDSRIPSSYSKSDRSRTSYYRDKDRGYRRSSPYSERSKSSRSKLGSDLRDASSCSDSEEDSRRYHSRSNDLRRTSLCSKSYRDSRKYQSRSDRDLRATSSCSESERETKRTKSHSKSDRISRTSASCHESESSKINSPEPESDSRKTSKLDTHSKISSFHSKASASCHKPEVVKTNSPDLELDHRKIAKSDSLPRTSSSHSKPVTSCHEVAAKKDSPEPEVDSKCFKLDSNSRALPSHSKLPTCGIEATQGDCSELESDSRSSHNPDINSRLSPSHSKSTTCCDMEVVKIESSESELDFWTKSKSDKNPMVTPSQSKPTTCYEMEVVKPDFAESELDSWTNSRLDKNSIVTQSHSKSTTCYEMEMVKMEPSEPEPELDSWENCKLDRKSRITTSSSRSCKARTSRSYTSGKELKRTSFSESEDEFREVPELHKLGAMQTVSRSDEICSSFDYQLDNYVSNSPYSTSDLTRAFCRSRFAVEITGPSPASNSDGPLTKVSSCSESEEERGSSPRCEAALTVLCHSVSNELPSSPSFVAQDLKTTPHPSPDETRSLAHPKLEEFSTWHYSETEEILACPKLDEAASVPCLNMDALRTVSVDVKNCTREAKHIGERSTENRDVDSQREQHISEVDGAESKHDRLFHNCKSKPNVVPGNQNWDSLENVRMYADFPSQLPSEAQESSEVKPENPSIHNEETSLPARPDSSVKVESEQSMEISEDEEDSDEELPLEAAAEGPLPLNAANPLSSSEAEHSLQHYQTKSDCDSSCMKAECNSVNSENEECLGVVKSSSEQESEESETSSDSDDSGVPRNRLQSVIIVPKNSTLTLEKSLSSSPSSSSPPSRSSRQEKKQPSLEGGKREAEEKPSQEHELNSVQFGSGPQEFVGGWAQDDDEVQGSQLSSPKAAEEQPQASSSQLSPAGETRKSSKQQLSSDKADSTSQPDRFSPDQNRLPLADEKSGAAELAQQSVDRLAERHQHPLGSYSDSPAAGESIAQPSGGVEKSQGEKPDSGQAIPWLQQQAREQGSFHSPEFVDSLDWDISQPEKPSSSCQQPDSSYGLRYGYRTEEADLAERSSCWQAGRANYWDPRLHSKSALYSSYQLSQDISGSDVQGQVQPDSMTDDFAIYNSWEAVTRDPRTVAKGVSSLQAHEITSNSSKGTTLVLKASDSTADKEQRAKGLEKRLEDEQGESQKPQQEEVDTDLESDTDTRDCEQVNTEPEPHPVMPCKEWVTLVCKMEEFKNTQCWKEQSKLGLMPPYFELIEENLYLTERKKSKSHRDIKRMQCECLLSREDRERGELACGEDCLNRLLMIECSSRCLHGEYCTNRRFQRRQYADVEVILTERKGWGLRTDKELSVNSFVLEYCGEVLDHKEFKARVKEYARNKNIHYYFMALKNDE